MTQYICQISDVVYFQKILFLFIFIFVLHFNWNIKFIKMNLPLYYYFILLAQQSIMLIQTITVIYRIYYQMSIQKPYVIPLYICQLIFFYDLVYKFHIRFLWDGVPSSENFYVLQQIFYQEKLSLFINYVIVYLENIYIEGKIIKAMKPQAMNIIKMISKPINQRMPFEGVELTKFVQKLTFFKKYFPYQSQKFISFCLTSSFMQFKAGDDLYAKQKKPNLIYIIVNGSVQVQSKHSKIIRTVQSYDLTGQVEVVFGLQQRGEKVTVMTNTYCMVLKAENFAQVWQRQDEVQKAYKYLCSNQYFQKIAEYQKKQLSLLMIKNYFKAYQNMALSNTLTQKVYFIVYGKVNVIKKLKIKQAQKQVILESLQQMDSFGQYQAVHKLISEVTLQTISSGSYYSIYIADAIKIKNPFVELIQQNGLPYPDKEQLEFRYEFQTKVEKYQDKIKKKLYLYK